MNLQSQLNEEEVSYCNKKDCGNAAIDLNHKESKNNPKLKHHFNGHGRIDATYSNPFKVYRLIGNLILYKYKYQV